MAARYVKGKDAAVILGVSQVSLRRYDASGKIKTIRTPGGKRLYDVTSLTGEKKAEKINICYCRVSSYGQREDLDRQIKFMTDKYPNFELISDIGSGINFKRPGLQKIIDYAIQGKLGQVVVAYKDRLCRIGYDLLEHIFTTYSQAVITVDSDKKETINEEIASDILEIINVYSAKVNGMRKYKVKKDNI
jgi:predicted site-specific integrase-resolvase